MIGDFLANRIQKTIKKNMRKAMFQLEDITVTCEELRINLLESDVNQTVVDALLDKVAKRAKTELVAHEFTPSQMMIKIMHEEVQKILGGNVAELIFKNKPAVIMLVGTNGSGKTTTTAKLANFIHKKYSRKPLLVACDVYRPAAIEQLKILGKQINLPVFAMKPNIKPAKIAKQALMQAKKLKCDTVILDTAGRLSIDENLIAELSEIRNVTNPQEILIVVDGMSGQDIINTVSSFHEKLKLTGVIVTKLDSDTKGGAALSIRYASKLPIKLIGTGEKISAIQQFFPDRTADRILGMGDIKTLFETINDDLDHRTMKITMQRMMRGQFDLQDMYNQLKQMKKIGSMQKLAKMIPGANKISPEKLQTLEHQFFDTTQLLNSMTHEERTKIRLIKHLTRKKRIIQGSGTSEKSYNKMLNHYDKSKKQVDSIAKAIKQGRMPNFNNSNF